MSKVFKKLKSGFTQIPNSIFEIGLSSKAIGLYAFIMSRADGWEFSIDGTASVLKEGRYGIRTGIQELEAARYLKREQKRENNKFVGSDWYITDEPFPIEENLPLDDFQPSGNQTAGNLTAGNLTAGNQPEYNTIGNNTVLNNNIPTNTENTNTGGLRCCNENGLLFSLETPEEEKRKKVALKKEKIPFDTFWDEYDKKVDRPKCEGKWERLTSEEQQAVLEYIPLYKIAESRKQFRKDPATFLNNRSWENELIKKAEINGANQQKSGKGDFNGSRAERTTAGQYALGEKLHQLLTGQPI